MSTGLYSHTTRATGVVLTAAIYNADHQNHITNQNPAMMGGYSDNVSQMQENADPGGVGTESLAASMADEIKRLRFAIKRLAGGAQWYSAPAGSSDVSALIATGLSGTGTAGSEQYTDLNSVTKTTFFRTASPHTNAPTGVICVGINVTRATDRQMQVAMPLQDTEASTQLYWRMKTNAGWSAWRRALQPQDFATEDTSPQLADFLYGETGGSIVKFSLTNVMNLGAVKQIKHASTTDIQNIDGGTWQDFSGLSVSITPKSTSNLILLLCMLNIVITPSNTSPAYAVRFMRGSTPIILGATAGSRTLGTSGGWGVSPNPGDSYGPEGAIPLIGVDSPSTVSATTYKVQGNDINNCSIEMNRRPSDSDNAQNFRAISTLVAVEFAP